jgi:hypothetical protein
MAPRHDRRRRRRVWARTKAGKKKKSAQALVCVAIN